MQLLSDILTFQKEVLHWTVEAKKCSKNNHRSNSSLKQTDEDSSAIFGPLTALQISLFRLQLQYKEKLLTSTTAVFAAKKPLGTDSNTDKAMTKALKIAAILMFLGLIF